MASAVMKLRPFGVADATLVASWLDGPGLALPPGNAASRWAERLVADPRMRAWVATRGAEPMGFARLDVGPDRIAELTIAVAPLRRRQGVGSRLLKLVLYQAQQLRIRRLQAIVDPANAAALSFFAENGFEEADGNAAARTFVRWLHEPDREVLELEAD
jgi:GNAT superfamily N-acetyltransferase